MSARLDQIKPYHVAGLELIPLLAWNKKINGVERGKTPLHREWTTKPYKQTPKTYSQWVSAGYNIGYRIGERGLVVDLDPRNYDPDIDSESLVAELFDFFDMEELIWELPVVRTGSGGYHIYCELPEGVDYKLIRKAVKELPGVDFKKKGGYVVAAGSRHPNGEYYEWETESLPVVAPDALLKLITRDPGEQQHTDYKSGYGALNGTQLQHLILDKLDPTNYSDNDSWFPILAASHHSTGGTGIEEFVEWSLSDPDYSNDEHLVRLRWESLEDKKDARFTVGTLIREVDNLGEDSADIKAVMSFASEPDLDTDDDDSEEAEIMRRSKEIADGIDLSDVYHDPDFDDEELDGRALAMANDMHPASSDEDIMKCLRLIKAANSLEAMKAKEALVANKVMKMAAVSAMLKELDSKIADDLALIIANKTLEVTFNQGRHLTCPPSGILWGFHKTHWKQISDEFLSKLVQGVLHSLKDKIEIKAQELSLINQAVKLARIKVATLSDRINKTSLPNSVVNCKNGELWLNKDGSHELREHNYRSYLINCLDVVYDPSAECPLFMETLEEIFELYKDKDDMIRHMAEVMGYIVQPRKNMASWWLFRGPGGDGKSTILKVLGGILQDAQVMSSAKLLNVATSGGDNHQLTSLVGALNVVIEELPTSIVLRDEAMKMFSENTKMECNPKGKDRYQFMYAGTLVMCSNGYPKTKDITHGFIRRANVIPFNRQFTKDGSADIDRADRILSDPVEMAGVLNFMLEGLQRLRDRGGFVMPVSCQIATDDWLSQANNVTRFVEETIEKSSGAILGDLKSLYEISYGIWCQDNDIDETYRLRKSTFKQELINLGFAVEKGGGNVMKVYGGRLLEEIDEEWG